MAAANEYVLAQGLRDTRSTIEAWESARWTVLRSWIAAAVAIACILLAAVWAVASAATPDTAPVHLVGINYTAGLSDTLTILGRNGLVLAFHAMACIAGFIAGSSMPIAAQTRTGFSRWIHVQAGKLAILLVALVTLFSLTTQAYILGSQCSTIANQLDISTGALILSVLPQALPELAALFLPLAAWLLASRSGEWRQLLAATFVTVAVAIPVLVLSAVWETYAWPHILIELSPRF